LPFDGKSEVRKICGLRSFGIEVAEEAFEFLDLVFGAFELPSGARQLFFDVLAWFFESP